MAEVVTQDENPTRRKTLQERLTTLIESNMRNVNLNHAFNFPTSALDWTVQSGVQTLDRSRTNVFNSVVESGMSEQGHFRTDIFNCTNVEKRLIQAPLVTYQIPYIIEHIIIEHIIWAVENRLFYKL